MQGHLDAARDNIVHGNEIEMDNCTNCSNAEMMYMGNVTAYLEILREVNAKVEDKIEGSFLS